MFIIERKHPERGWERVTSTQLGHHSDCFYSATLAKSFMLGVAERTHVNFAYRVVRPEAREKRRAVHVLTAATVLAIKQQLGKKPGEW